MSKQALCIPKEQVSLPLAQWSPCLIARAQCETDESVLQLIPYIVFKDRDSQEIFLYTRGRSGNESRLYNKHSIGIGGHVDIAVLTDGVPTEHALAFTLALEAAREIEEEVGYSLTEAECEALLQTLISERFIRLYTPESRNPVDRVHLGLAIVLEIDKARLGTLEQGVILQPSWLSVDLLKHMSVVETDTDQLETWSKLCVQCLF